MSKDLIARAKIILKIKAVDMAGNKGIEKPLLYERKEDIEALAVIEDLEEREKLLQQILQKIGG